MAPSPWQKLQLWEQKDNRRVSVGQRVEATTRDRLRTGLFSLGPPSAAAVVASIFSVAITGPAARETDFLQEEESHDQTMLSNYVGNPASFEKYIYIYQWIKDVFCHCKY